MKQGKGACFRQPRKGGPCLPTGYIILILTPFCQAINAFSFAVGKLFASVDGDVLTKQLLRYAQVKDLPRRPTACSKSACFAFFAHLRFCLLPQLNGTGYSVSPSSGSPSSASPSSAIFASIAGACSCRSDSSISSLSRKCTASLYRSSALLR